MGACFLGLSLQAWAAEKIFNFDKDKAGSAPKGLTMPGSAWRVVADPHAPSKPNVLLPPQGILAGGAGSQLFIPKVSMLDGDVGVRAKLMQDDRPALLGFIWRFQNPANYYVAQIDLQSGAVAIMRITHGKTKTLAHDVMMLTPFVWHLFQVHVQGTRMAIICDGQAALSADDKAIEISGQIGITASAGDELQMDDLAVLPLETP
jgi:hypothetical protein